MCKSCDQTRTQSFQLYAEIGSGHSSKCSFQSIGGCWVQHLQSQQCLPILFYFENIEFNISGANLSLLPETTALSPAPECTEASGIGATKFVKMNGWADWTVQTLRNKPHQYLCKHQCFCNSLMRNPLCVVWRVIIDSADLVGHTSAIWNCVQRDCADDYSRVSRGSADGTVSCRGYPASVDDSSSTEVEVGGCSEGSLVWELSQCCGLPSNNSALSENIWHGWKNPTC